VGDLADDLDLKSSLRGRYDDPFEEAAQAPDRFIPNLRIA